MNFFHISKHFSNFSKLFFKGVIHIDIKIQKYSRIKTLLKKIYNRSEDLFFTLISKIPESMIPRFVMNWLEHYTNKRIAELQQQIIRDRWRSVELDDFLQQINNEK